MITLYGIGLSNNVNKVRYCLNHLGLEYEWVQTSPMQGENQTEEFLQIAPTGKIPAIEVDGVKLFESNAINRYLATIHNSSIYPQDPKVRALVDAWMDFGAIHIAMAASRIMFNRLVADMVGKERDEKSEQAGIEFLEKFLPICDQQLGKTPYLASNELTLADINLLAILDPFEVIEVSLESYSNITKWRNQLIAQDFYQKCYRSYTEFLQQQMAQMK